MKRITIILSVLAFAVASLYAQSPRYPNQWTKNRTLSPQHLKTWNIGNGEAGDTTLLSANYEYEPFYYTGDNPFQVEVLAIAIQSGVGNDTLGVHVCWSDTIADATPSYLNTSAYPVSKLTTVVETLGVEDVSFNDADIPVGSWVWVKLSAVTTLRKPKQVVISLYGHVQDENGN